MAKKSKKRIPTKEETVRVFVPVSLISIKDTYKKKIGNRLKEKHSKALTDKVIFEVLTRCLKEIPLEEAMNKIPKKYWAKPKKTKRNKKKH